MLQLGQYAYLRRIRGEGGQHYSTVPRRKTERSRLKIEVSGAVSGYEKIGGTRSRNGACSGSRVKWSCSERFGRTEATLYVEAQGGIMALRFRRGCHLTDFPVSEPLHRFFSGGGGRRTGGVTKRKGEVIG